MGSVAPLPAMGGGDIASEPPCGMTASPPAPALGMGGVCVIIVVGVPMAVAGSASPVFIGGMGSLAMAPAIGMPMFVLAPLLFASAPFIAIMLGFVLFEPVLPPAPAIGSAAAPAPASMVDIIMAMAPAPPVAISELVSCAIPPGGSTDVIGESSVSDTRSLFRRLATWQAPSRSGTHAIINHTDKLRIIEPPHRSQWL
jgi:hypothetical protein